MEIKDNIEIFDKRRKQWNKYKPYLVTVGKWVLVLGGVTLIKVLENMITDNDDSEDETEQISYDLEDVQQKKPEDNLEIVRNPRYIVQFRAIKTGDWYTKTKTNSVAAAYSVFHTQRNGRAARLLDSDTGEIILDQNEG